MRKYENPNNIDPSEWSIDSLVEIKFSDPDDFTKIKEVLTRIGVSPASEKKLFQSCHILHKQGKYFLVHFKELHLIDGQPTNLEDRDIHRRNRICALLEEWNMITILDKSKIEKQAEMRDIKVITRRDINDGWVCIPKYIFASERRKRK